jgi:superfamily II DNA or RNA helicase
MDASTKKQEQIASIMRMKALMGFSTKEQYVKSLMLDIDEKCIIFCNTQDQANRMCKHSYHSSNPDSEDNLQDFKNGKIEYLSCVLQLNEGINIPDLRVGIIMHAYGNERKASQRIGRLLRLNPTETAVVHILCYKNTVDERWVGEALKDFDQSKIKYFDVDDTLR